MRPLGIEWEFKQKELCTEKYFSTGQLVRSKETNVFLEIPIGHQPGTTRKEEPYQTVYSREGIHCRVQ